MWKDKGQRLVKAFELMAVQIRKNIYIYSITKNLRILLETNELKVGLKDRNKRK
jgi:hypothetical protein